MIIGLTGSSGSGKSLACEFFIQKGFLIIDFDKISREVTEKGSPCLLELTNYFGGDIIDKDGSLRRKHLGEIVFSNREKLKKLNEITHKYIFEKADRIKRENADKNIVYDAPLLFEGGLNEQCDYVISIGCDFKTQVDRIVKRDGISQETAISRIKSQHNENYFMEKSDYFIKNDSSREDFFNRLNIVLEEILQHDICN